MVTPELLIDKMSSADSQEYIFLTGKLTKFKFDKLPVESVSLAIPVPESFEIADPVELDFRIEHGWCRGSFFGISADKVVCGLSFAGFSGGSKYFDLVCSQFKSLAENN